MEPATARAGAPADRRETMPMSVAPVTDERQALLAFLAQQRTAVANAAYGLTEKQARATTTASTLSVGGLVKHLAAA
ncbi:MAG: DUF664 domain-containing protein, partial [Acidimicrobiales bacterium]